MADCFSYPSFYASKYMTYTLCTHASAQLSAVKYFVHLTLQLPVKGNFPENVNYLPVTAIKPESEDRIQQSEACVKVGIHLSIISFNIFRNLLIIIKYK